MKRECQGGTLLQPPLASYLQDEEKEDSQVDYLPCVVSMSKMIQRLTDLFYTL